MIIITASPILKLIIDGGHIRTYILFFNKLIFPPRYVVSYNFRKNLMFVEYI